MIEISLKIIFFFVLNCFIYLCIDLFLFSLRKTGSKRILGSFLGFLFQITFTQMVLGLLSILYVPILLIINLLISFALFHYAKRGNKSITANYINDLRNNLKEQWGWLKSNRFELFLLLIFTAALLWILFLGTIFPAIDWDGNSYHLTFVGNAIQNHSILDVPASLKWIAGYPKGGELLALWNTIFIKNDIFADLIQLPFILAGAYSLFSLCKKLGAKKEESFFSALLIVFIPIAFNQLKTTYVDLILTSMFFITLDLIFEKTRKRFDLLLLGWAFALILSIKATGALFVAVLGAGFVIYEVARKQNLRSIVRELSVLILPMMIGLFWYVKNIFAYGTPLYPFGIKLLGANIFPGPTFNEFAADAISAYTFLPKGSLERIWYVWTEQKGWWGCLYNYDANFSGLGPIWFTILVPATIVATYLYMKDKKWLFFGIASLAATLFFLYPLNYYPRYTMFIVGIGIISLSYVLGNIPRYYSFFVKTVAISLSIFVLATNFALCNFPPSVIKSQLKNNSIVDDRGLAYTNTLGKSYLELQNIMNSGDTVVYSKTSMFVYPLWKKNFSNNVIYLESNNISEWRELLKVNGADYIFTGRTGLESEWSKTSDFVLVYEDTEYEIYKTK